MEIWKWVALANWIIWTKVLDNSLIKRRVLVPGKTASSSDEQDLWTSINAVVQILGKEGMSTSSKSIDVDIYALDLRRIWPLSLRKMFEFSLIGQKLTNLKGKRKWDKRKTALNINSDSVRSGTVYSGEGHNNPSLGGPWSRSGPVCRSQTSHGSEDVWNVNLM